MSIKNPPAKTKKELTPKKGYKTAVKTDEAIRW